MKTSMHSDIFRHFRPFGILIQIFEVRFKKSGRKTTEDNYRVKTRWRTLVWGGLWRFYYFGRRVCIFNLYVISGGDC